MVIWYEGTRWQIRDSGANNLDDVTPPKIELETVRFLFYTAGDMRPSKSKKYLLPIVGAVLVITLIAVVLWALSKNQPFFSDEQVQHTSGISASAESLSPFMAHYVGMGKRFVRIPSTFCPQEYYDDLHTIGACQIGTASIEVDLKEHGLPVDSIVHAVTDGNGKIAYTVYKEESGKNSCDRYDVYIYDLSSKEVKKIKNDSMMWICGAGASYLRAFSVGGRYLEIGSFGTHALWPQYYDLKNDRFDEEISRYPGLVYFFSLEESNEEQYTIYTEGEKEFHGPNGMDRPYTLHLRDNGTGKSIRLESIERQLALHNVKLENIISIQYKYSNGTLTLWEEGLAGYVLTIPNFNRMIENSMKQ